MFCQSMFNLSSLFTCYARMLNRYCYLRNIIYSLSWNFASYPLLNTDPLVKAFPQTEKCYYWDFNLLHVFVLMFVQLLVPDLSRYWFFTTRMCQFPNLWQEVLCFVQLGYLYLTNVQRLEDIMLKLGFSTGVSSQSVLEETADSK